MPGVHIGEQKALLHSGIRLYNEITDGVRTALIEGVWCPGILGEGVKGYICFDTSGDTLDERVMRLFSVYRSDETPLEPFAAETGGNVMALWHIENFDTPQWLSLSRVLTDIRSRTTFRLFCSPAGRRCFVAYSIIDTLRFALVFERVKRYPSDVVYLD